MSKEKRYDASGSRKPTGRLEQNVGRDKIFYDGLIRAGFDDGHAMFLTNEFMKTTINGISEKTVAAAMEYLKNK